MRIKKLMMVDDDADDREIFLTVMESSFPNMEIVTAENGKDALEKLSKDAVMPDLIVLDLNMPLMNGKQFLEKIGLDRILRQINVVILSTSSDPANITETKKLGAKQFITKPDKFDEWERAIRTLINNVLA